MPSRSGRRFLQPLIEFPHLVRIQLDHAPVVGHQAVELILHIAELRIDRCAPDGRDFM